MVWTAAAVILATVAYVAAWPGLAAMREQLEKDGVSMRDIDLALEKRYVEPPPRAPLGKLNRPNTGLPPSGFNYQDQYVDTTDSGPNPFQAPGPNDIRGQCPGLNAAANHGFLNRNGLTTITQGKWNNTSSSALANTKLIGHTQPSRALVPLTIWEPISLHFWPSSLLVSLVIL